LCLQGQQVSKPSGVPWMHQREGKAKIENRVWDWRRAKELRHSVCLSYSTFSHPEIPVVCGTSA
jgi:hypothetical protein